VTDTIDIAYVNRMLGLTRGGGEIWDLRISQALKRHHVDVTFYIGSPLSSESDSNIDDFRVVEVPTPHLRDLAYAAPRGIGGILEDVDACVFRRQVLRKLEEAEHDVVHVSSDPRFANVRSGFECPLTLTMHGSPHSFWYDTVRSKAGSYDLISQFDAVTATGQTAEQLHQLSGTEVVRIDPGVDSGIFTPADDGTEAPYDTGPFTLLYVGRLVPVKNVPFLVAAFADFHRQFPNSQLLLVGDGPKRGAIESAISDHGVNDSVKLPGYVRNEELPRWYRNADAFALASKHESFGMVLLEAMSCGVPVVAPAIDCIPRIIEDGADGLLYEPGAKPELIDHLNRLYRNEPLRRKLSETARTSVESGYDWDSRARQLRKVFEGVLFS